MNAAKILSALDSVLRREILMILAEEPSTALEVLNKLKRKKLKVEYRETVYRALEKLVEAELAEKFYVKKKGLCYGLSKDHLTITIRKDSIDFTDRKK